MKPPRTSPITSPPLGFTLLELLVATTVLSLMMVFLFTLVSQTLRAWDNGNRRVEAAQAARVGLQRMAEDLQFALGGVGTALPLTVGGATRTASIPFFATNSASTTHGFPGSFTAAPSSAQIFTVAPIQSRTNELGEIGYLSLYCNTPSGYDHIPGPRYYLMRHMIPGTGSTPSGNFYFSGIPDSTWLTEGNNAIQNRRRTPIIPNCYQINLLYASNSPGGLTFQPTWTSQTNLPAGILVTAKVMDSKTADRVARMQPSGLGTSDVAANSSTDVGRVLREGTVEVSRFIPFYNSRP